mgnify:CR=1 FL=1
MLGGADAVAFASGMGAITGTLWTLRSGEMATVSGEGLRFAARAAPGGPPG